MTSILNLTLIHLVRQRKQAVEMPGLYAMQAPFRAARGRSGDTLLLHLALDGTLTLGDQEQRKLVKKLAGIYFKTSGSSTLAMRTVAEWLNHFLVERNRQGANRFIQSAGLLTQAVFRGDHLYLAQCGPTHTFFVTSAGLTHYHISNIAWRGLGFTRVPEIRYHQEIVNPGDILLISPDPPPAWDDDRLIQLRNLSLEEMVDKLFAQIENDFEAGLMFLEPGSGKLNIIDPATIGALKLHSAMDRIEAESDGNQDRVVFTEEIEIAKEDESTDQDNYFQGLLPFEDIDEDESETASSDSSHQEDLASKSGTQSRHLPDEIIPESDEAEGSLEKSSGNRSGEVIPLAVQEIEWSRPADDRKDLVMPDEAQPSLGIPESKGSELPSWAWSLVVGVLLIGIIGLVFLIGQGFPGVSPGTNGMVQVSETMPLLILTTRIPSSTPMAIKTNTILPPTLTSTPLPLSATPTSSPTPKYRIGSTQVSPADKMIMVYVPDGIFNMGASEDDSFALRDERPKHRINLGAFWIDQTEVTNSQYAQCVEDRECRIPYSLTSYTRNPYYGILEFADYPVIFVSWNDAQDYCQWAGRRLPTEAEWEKAARGENEQLYPWGDDLDCDLANFKDCLGDTVDVRSFPDGASLYGVLNMAGNVWEWVADWYYFAYYDISPLDFPTGPESGAYRVIRGGSWNDDPIYLRTTSRYWYYPDNARFSVGFRCAISEYP